jgi:hypothetical protein
MLRLLLSYCLDQSALKLPGFRCCLTFAELAKSAMSVAGDLIEQLMLQLTLAAAGFWLQHRLTTQRQRSNYGKALQDPIKGLDRTISIWRTLRTEKERIKTLRRI